MARWDEILTLPVQNPPTLEFSAADIVWSRVEGWRESMDRLALIPFSRVNDFLRGESNNKECPTRFHVEARRRRPPEMAYKPKVDGILEYILYWCSFGPDDHRKGGIVRPSRNYSTKRKTPAGRPNTKRGCVCHFIVKRLIAEPSVALIIYNQDKHVDKKGLPCHGPLDKKAVGTRAMFAPYISDELHLQIMSLLYVGVPVETIMQRHTEEVEKQGGPCNRDDLLTHRYVRRLERKIRRSTYELDPDDAVSIGMWIESHPNHIFFYEDFSDSEPFVLGIQTEWQLQQMIRFGNRRLLAADSRFGTNKLKYPIYSLLVFDSSNNAIPIAWIMTPNFASGEIHKWMGALYDRVRTKDPSWKLGGFIVDDPSADVLTIREVFQCSVLISFWRVRHSWHKNLLEKCPETEMRVDISRRLGEVVSNICKGSGDMDSFEAFMEDFVDCLGFLDYFKATWFPRIATWTAALKALPLASTEVSAAIECYHHQLKLRLLNEKDSNVYHRADWLVDKLGTKVHSYYWLDEYSGKDNFARYWKDEWKSGLTSWRQALQIPDSDVVMDGKCAKVVSSENQEVHTVLNPGSEFALCDCSWSRMGNLCKHVVKLTIIYRDRGLVAPSTSLFEYNRTLMTILHCAPHDSVIRDHAIALSACVQTQLNALFDLENGSATTTTSDPMEQQTAAELGVTATNNRDNADKDLMNESPPVSENNAEALRNESHSVTEKYGVAGEIVNGTVADDITPPAETPSTGLLPVELQLPNDNHFVSDPMENEAGNLLKERPSLDSNTCNASRTGDDSQDDMSVDAFCDEATIHTANADQVSGDSHKNSVTEEMMNIDPQSIQCFPSTSRSRSGVIDGDTMGGCSSQMSDFNEKKASHVSMIIDAVEDTDVIYHGTEKEPVVLDDCDNSIVENVSLDHTNVAMESGVDINAENNGSKAQTIGTSGVDHNNYGDVDGAIGASMPNTEACSNGGMEVAAYENMNDSRMELRPCSEERVCTDQTMDVELVEEGFCDDNATKKDQSLSLTINGSSVKAQEAITTSVQLDSLVERVKLNQEIQSAVIDIQISADAVEETHVGNSSGVDEKDGTGLATDVPPAMDGISGNIEERFCNGHVILNMTLT